ncbi:SulP family inorganic anion transporter, partial [Kitasatospora sp. NPDC048545]|uniref:SulP family inorganic anion transporter n=1 Tax=Kitasatospora sp. NPDC048545 TaxID=3157208 RepID=UPI0033E05F79
MGPAAHDHRGPGGAGRHAHPGLPRAVRTHRCGTAPQPGPLRTVQPRPGAATAHPLRRNRGLPPRVGGDHRGLPAQSGSPTSASRARTPSHRRWRCAGPLPAAFRSAAHLTEAHLPTVAFSAATLLFLLLAARLLPRLPGPLLAVVLGTAISAAFSLKDHGLAVIGDIPAGLPRPALPDLTELNRLLMP